MWQAQEIIAQAHVNFPKLRKVTIGLLGPYHADGDFEGDFGHNGYVSPIEEVAIMSCPVGPDTIVRLIPLATH